MNDLAQGLISGLIFGSVIVACIAPMKIENKKAYMFGMFMIGFAIGFSIALTTP